ncbi:hypothetical protein TELCIR_02591 [Teladorsagia circumcincta]|uniref:Uncharacterized protein n=1 Tax=Teladorsagia circumcincta TaxID=45464 RepID=A0A2G9UYQ3_TELCI|nr:hypothetical protein TELCIR_02591 [Teladorsagia circumcincta]
MAHQFAVPQPRPPTQDNTVPAAAGGGEGEGRTNDPRAFPNLPQFPAFPFMAPLPPFPMEMPRPPPQLDQLTEEDLRAMEVPMPTATASDAAWQTMFGNQAFGGSSALDVTQSDSAQDVKSAQEGGGDKDATVQQNGMKTENTAADVPSSSKSLFGTSASSSRLTKTGAVPESSTTPEDRESPDIPSSSKETIVRSPEDEEIRLRRLKRFAEAGSSSEDR